MPAMTMTRIQNRIGVRASAEAIWDVMTDFGNWHAWNPYETGLEGRLGFGTPLSLQEEFPEQPARAVSATIQEWEPCGQLLWAEKRGFLFRSLRYYEIEPLEKNASIITNGIAFVGIRGELFHDKHRSKFRPALLDINERLKAHLEG